MLPEGLRDGRREGDGWTESVIEGRIEGGRDWEMKCKKGEERGGLGEEEGRKSG